MKKIIKNIFRKYGYNIHKQVPKEEIILGIQKKLTKADKDIIIFDVGAYQGETVLGYNRHFSGNCTIYAFEPFIEVFRELEKNTADYENIKLCKTALGNKKGTVTFHVNNFHATNSILQSDPKSQETWGPGLMETQRTIEVPMRTIDDFVAENNIAQIDILKLDTQGTEHLVLEGARKSIAKGMVKLICAEMIVMPTYEGQKELHEILALYKNLGYELYNVYNYVNSDGRVRFLDGIFIYEKY